MHVGSFSSTLLVYKAPDFGGTASPSADLPGYSGSRVDSLCLRTWIFMCVCLRMLAESWSILSQFIWHQDEVPQYYSEQLTFSVQPSIATVSLSNKTLGSSPTHFSWPRAVGRHLMQNYFACRQMGWRSLGCLRLNQHRACFSSFWHSHGGRHPPPDVLWWGCGFENQYLFSSPFCEGHNFTAWQYVSISLWASQAFHSPNTIVPDIGLICKLKKKWVWNCCVILGKLLNFSGLQFSPPVKRRMIMKPTSWHFYEDHTS